MSGSVDDCLIGGFRVLGLGLLRIDGDGPENVRHLDAGRGDSKGLVWTWRTNQ